MRISFRIAIAFIAVLTVLASCDKKKDNRKGEKIVAPWGDVIGETDTTANLFEYEGKIGVLPPESIGVVCHRYEQFIDLKQGKISRYDALFKKYSPQIGWDWRMLAALAYQESCFDPMAKSFAGACGLMQIMPSTGERLGLTREQLFQPEPSVRGAAKLLSQLTSSFGDVPGEINRQCFTMAAYNGGTGHVRDAMALCRKYGVSPVVWRNVARALLLLQTPEYSRDPVVKYGAMRGIETVNYVNGIMRRYGMYSGRGNGAQVPTVPQPFNVDPSAGIPNTIGAVVDTSRIMRGRGKNVQAQAPGPQNASRTAPQNTAGAADAKGAPTASPSSTEAQSGRRRALRSGEVIVLEP